MEVTYKMMDKYEVQEFIAKRVGRELKDGDIVNLGIGLPTKVANYVPEGKSIVFQSENGFVGLGPSPEEHMIDQYITNAGGAPVTILPGGAFFDSATSFGIIRGGHVDLTVLGALQVDEKGNIWIALWGLGKVVCYSPEGKEIQEISLPVPQPSSCCFGGIENDILFITTAREGLTSAEIQKYPHSGKVFCIKLSVRGEPMNDFSLELVC